METRLLPVTPTFAMVDAAYAMIDSLPPTDWGKLPIATPEQVYKAMLGAAPQLESPLEDLVYAAERLLSNWPSSRDGMDYEILPTGVLAMREALKKVSP